MIASLICSLWLGASSSAPAETTGKEVALSVRVLSGSNKATTPQKIDPKLKDLEGSLKDLKFTSYEMKDQTSLTVTVSGPEVKYTTPFKRTLHVQAFETKLKGKQEQVHVQLSIPELKFKTSAWISKGATLVVGGPKYEDGVLLFALGASK
jgi:hypothetical protein